MECTDNTNLPFYPAFKTKTILSLSSPPLSSPLPPSTVEQFPHYLHRYPTPYPYPLLLTSLPTFTSSIQFNPTHNTTKPIPQPLPPPLTYLAAPSRSPPATHPTRIYSPTCQQTQATHAVHRAQYAYGNYKHHYVVAKKNMYFNEIFKIKQLHPFINMFLSLNL